VSFYLAVVFLVLVHIGLYKIWRAYVQAKGRTRVQLTYLFWATLIGYLGGTPDWSFPLGFYVPVLNPFGVYAVPLYSVATTYALLQHQLFDFNLVIRRSLIYSLLVTVLTVVYFAAIHVAEHIFQIRFGYTSVQLSLAAFALMALVFQPLKIGIQRIVDLLLFRAPQEELVKRMERLEQETRQTEKLKSVATLAAGMAHEIKNPLASIKTFVQYLPVRHDDPEFREKFVRIVGHEVERMNLLVQRLLDFAKPSPPKSERCRISPVIEETVDFLHSALTAKQIEVVRGYGESDDVFADRAQLKQVLLNILLNSIDALDGRGCIAISTVSDGGYVHVIVADTGRGISKSELGHVFDPFYTTKAHGTGLGLSVVHSIIREHRGHITIDSDVGRGTTVRMRFPMYQADRPLPVDRPASLATANGRSAKPVYAKTSG